MKKSLIVLAALGAFAGVASAQSSVTLFGIVDVGARYVKNGDADAVKSMSTSGLASSRIGFRGVEDLGSGLKAGFHLEGALSADTGAADTTRFFGRRATVSLLGGFGEVRLGRDVVPTHWGWGTYDTFNTNGVGAINDLIADGGAATKLRSDNAVSYLTPNSLGGFYAQLTGAPGEGGTNTKYAGGRVGFANGPVDVSVSAGKTTVGANDFDIYGLGLTYNLGFAKVLGIANKQDLENGAKRFVGSLGVHVPVGAGTIRFSAARANQLNSSADANKFALGYVHDLSKRTALYTTAAVVKNFGTQNISVAGTDAAAAGKKSKGFEFGVRHSF